MPVITRTFPVAPAPAAVTDYLKDFAHAEEWDPGTVRCVRTDSGPIAVGSVWHNVSKINGVSTELDYTLQEFTDERLVFVGRNKTATSTDTITVRPAGSGSEVTYHADIRFNGLAKLADPLMKLVFEKVGNDLVTKLTGVLAAR